MRRPARALKLSCHPSVQVTTPNWSGSGSSCSGKKYETRRAVFSHPSRRACGVSGGMGSEVDRLEMSKSCSGSLSGGTTVGICATASVTMSEWLALWKKAVSQSVVGFPPIEKVPPSQVLLGQDILDKWLERSAASRRVRQERRPQKGE